MIIIKLVVYDNAEWVDKRLIGGRSQGQMEPKRFYVVENEEEISKLSEDKN